MQENGKNRFRLVICCLLIFASHAFWFFLPPLLGRGLHNAPNAISLLFFAPVVAAGIGLLCLPRRRHLSFSPLHIYAFTLVVTMGLDLSSRFLQAGYGGISEFSVFVLLIFLLPVYVAAIAKVIAKEKSSSNMSREPTRKSIILWIIAVCVAVLFVPLIFSLGLAWVCGPAGDLQSTLAVAGAPITAVIIGISSGNFVKIFLPLSMFLILIIIGAKKGVLYLMLVGAILFVAYWNFWVYHFYVFATSGSA